jgi:predicted transposase/invertase (TIGR01784 family)
MTINRKNDYAFKRIFGHEDSKDVLARFLSVVLSVSIVPEELTLVQTELSPEYAADKNSVLDIQVRRSEFHCLGNSCSGTSKAEKPADKG